LNAYLERTGDYAGVLILRFYVVYRAMVRAKVAAMRASQTQDGGARDAQVMECRAYLELAQRCAGSAPPAIVITHGPTGSGKTTGSQALIELLGAIRIRTDVERKRRHGLRPESRSGSALNAGLYSAAEIERTYATVAALTHLVVSAGYPAIVDGTFLRARERDRFRALAERLRVPFAIADFVAHADILRARVRRRLEAGGDASEADLHVLEHQRQTAEPLTASERALTVTCDASAPVVETGRELADALAQRFVAVGGRCASEPAMA
jgi:predicted kinase